MKLGANIRRTCMVGAMLALVGAARTQLLTEPWLELAMPTNLLPAGHPSLVTYGNGTWLILAPAALDLGHLHGQVFVLGESDAERSSPAYMHITARI